MLSALSRLECITHFQVALEEGAHCVQGQSLLPHGSSLGEELCDTYTEAVELHSCFKTLVTSNSAEILRLSHALSLQTPPQCALFSFFRISPEESGIAI